jgi:hypothetical protein
MGKNEYITNYNQSLLDDINLSVLGFVDVHLNIHGVGKPNQIIGLEEYIKPEKEITLVDKNSLKNLINLYSNRCQSIKFDDIEVYELENENEFSSTYVNLTSLIDSLVYSNIIKFKNKSNLKELKSLYFTNYLLDYIAKISPSRRGVCVWDEGKFINYKNRVEVEFSEDFKIIVDDKRKLFDFTKIFLDLNNLNGIFWKLCTVNKIFKDVSRSISFTRFLQNFSDEINSKKYKLRYEFKEKNNIRTFASNGGFAKAKKYQEKMHPIFDEVFTLFESRKWKSKAECVKYFIKNFYSKNPNTDIELDSKKMVAEITNRINDRAASRKVTLLVDRSTC